MNKKILIDSIIAVFILILASSSSAVDLNIDGDNQRPNKPTIFAPLAIEPNIEYTYEFVSEDPDGDKVSYYIDWGSYSTGWTSYYDSGIKIKLNHTYNAIGTYTTRAKAKDIHGAESYWSYWTIHWKDDHEIITLINGEFDSYDVFSKGIIRDIRFFGKNITVRGLRIIDPTGEIDVFKEFAEVIRATKYLGYLRSNYTRGIAFGKSGWY